MSGENEILRFALPDLLGSPIWMTDKKGSFVTISGEEIPANCAVFFIPMEEWKELVRISKGG